MKVPEIALDSVVQDEIGVNEKVDEIGMMANCPNTPRRSGRSRKSNGFTIDVPAPRVTKPRGPVRNVESDEESTQVLPADQYTVSVLHCAACIWPEICAIDWKQQRYDI